MNHVDLVLKLAAAKMEPGPKKAKNPVSDTNCTQKMDIEYELIRELETTTAKVHDSRIDLSKPDEIMYRDRGYFGGQCKGHNATMNRATRGHPLRIHDKMRNKRISRKRSPGEQPYAVIKTIFHSGHTRLTTTLRNHTRNIFNCLSYNLLQLNTLTYKSDKLANAIIK